MTILVQAILVHVQTTHWRVSRQGLVSFASLLRRIVLMVRKGWSAVQVPDGWLLVVRGPRPKLEQWPLQARLPSVAHSAGTPPVRGRRSGPHNRRGEQNSVTASSVPWLRCGCCQSRSRSSIATCQKPGQRCHAQSCACLQDDVRSCTSQSGEFGGSSRQIFLDPKSMFQQQHWHVPNLEKRSRIVCKRLGQKLRV